MAGSNPGERRGGRKKGTANKTTVARKTAEKAVVDALNVALGGDDVDAYAVLVAMYRNPDLEPHTRMVSAKAALPYERAPVSDSRPKSDAPPLAERVRDYERRVAIEASAGKVVPLKK